MTDIPLQVARFADLDTTTLYALLKLRVDVFVVEQQCPYPELDGRDAEPGTLHIWAGPDDAPAGYLRVLEDPDGTARIGRVCTASGARRAGVAGGLVARALSEIGDRPCRLAAQTYLTDFYARYGFTAAGPEFVEDGIPHLPMQRAADSVRPDTR